MYHIEEIYSPLKEIYSPINKMNGSEWKSEQFWNGGFQKYNLRNGLFLKTQHKFRFFKKKIYPFFMLYFWKPPFQNRGFYSEAFKCGTKIAILFNIAKWFKLNGILVKQKIFKKKKIIRKRRNNKLCVVNFKFNKLKFINKIAPWSPSFLSQLHCYMLLIPLSELNWRKKNEEEQQKHDTKQKIYYYYRSLYTY